MRKLLIILLAVIGIRANATEVLVQMQERFGPSGVFSVMVPTDWVIGTGENFTASAPYDGPHLGGMAYRIERRPELSEFSGARYQGVEDMGIYKQVGQERSLGNDGGVIREYEGGWPGDKFITYYIVACKSAGDIYACISLVTTKEDYNSHRVFYAQMFSSFAIHP